MSGNKREHCMAMGLLETHWNPLVIEWDDFTRLPRFPCRSWDCDVFVGGCSVLSDLELLFKE